MIFYLQLSIVKFKLFIQEHLYLYKNIKNNKITKCVQNIVLLDNETI